MVGSPNSSSEFVDLLARLSSKRMALVTTHDRLGAKLGYASESLATFSGVYSGLIHSGSTGPDLLPTLRDGFMIGQSLESRVDSLMTEAQQLENEVDETINLLSASSSAAVSAHLACDLLVTYRWQPCPFEPTARQTMCAQKLQELAPTLAEVYRAAWSAYYGQTHDPRRSALWQIRQTIDHLFEVLAPDEVVRSSRYWTPKEKGKTNAVYRVERFTYAAHRWIGDETARNVLLGAVSQINRTYERLNIAHQRGELDQDRASDTFRAADDILWQWVDAIRPWPPQGPA